MSGDDFREEGMLAAVKPLKAVESSADYGDCAERFTQTPTKDAGTTVSEEWATLSDLERLFREHHKRVFRTAWRVTGSAADAEDVLQTVFLRLARGPESPGISENPEGYFARAAINASLDLLRSRKRSKAVAMDDLENRPPTLSSPQNPERCHEDRELRELIRAAVSRLGPAAGQMFALRYFEGHSNGEIARMMSTSALVVGVTLHRARARLRKEIGNYLEHRPQ
jgi:RNA polymerase sigma factor (sigma-70 family)